jgi:hypothetical protein
VVLLISLYQILVLTSLPGFCSESFLLRFLFAVKINEHSGNVHFDHNRKLVLLTDVFVGSLRQLLGQRRPVAMALPTHILADNLSS